MPKKYPLEFKKQAIRRYEKGESIPALCQELHISQSTFYHWRNQYRSIQTSAHTYTPAEFDVLVRRLQKAEHKLSIIQYPVTCPKCLYRTSWPLWSIMRSQKHSLPHLKKRRPTGVNTLLNGIFGRAWMSISVFIMRFAPIKR